MARNVMLSAKESMPNNYRPGSATTTQYSNHNSKNHNGSQTIITFGLALMCLLVIRVFVVFSPTFLFELTTFPSYDGMYFDTFLATNGSTASPTLHAAKLFNDTQQMVARVENTSSSSSSPSLSSSTITTTSVVTNNKTSHSAYETNSTTESAAASNEHTIPSIVTSVISATTNKTIRKWGCHRRETPLIFVHIGKAGGGEIRSRLAVAAKNYNRMQWFKPETDNHYYPIAMYNVGGGDNSTEESFRRGKFCNSVYGNSHKIPRNNNTQPLSNRPNSFEGDKYCNATTPFGMIIACPIGYGYTARTDYESKLCMACDDEYYLEEEYYEHIATNASQKSAAASVLLDPPPPGHTCDTVYVSHNSLGGELNWLPPRYLREHWWDNSPWKERNAKSDTLERYWDSLLRDRIHRRRVVLNKLNNTLLKKISARNYNDSDIAFDDNSQRWCPVGYIGIDKGNEIQHDRPRLSNNDWEENKSRYECCTKPIGEAADRAFREFWTKSHPEGSTGNSNGNFSDDSNYSPIYASLPLHRVVMLREPFSWLISKFFWDPKIFAYNKCDNIHIPSYENPTMSWIELYSLQYLFYLCGFECETRFENNMISLEGIEAQAEDNLRNAFSVVGLLHESDSFYEMIHKRIDYMDARKTLRMKGQRHASRVTTETRRCKQLFLNDTVFQDNLRSSLPAFAAVERVYNVGVAVKRFQQNELDQCDR